MAWWDVGLELGRMSLESQTRAMSRLPLTSSSTAQTNLRPETWITRIICGRNPNLHFHTMIGKFSDMSIRLSSFRHTPKIAFLISIIVCIHHFHKIYDERAWDRTLRNTDFDGVAKSRESKI